MSNKTVHHFIVPHCDDAVLSFGGTILNIIQNLKSEEIHVHVVFGYDKYMRKDFISAIKFKKKYISHYLKVISNSAQVGLGLLKDEITNNLNRLDSSEIGFYIRDIEERSISNTLGYKLHKYNYPAAYPLRGYKKFNSKVSSWITNDIDYQVNRIIFGPSKIKEKELLRLSRYKDTNSSSVLNEIINFQPKGNGKQILYFLAGIGGHPDHIILAKVALKLKNMKLKNTKILIGQDLPYACINEWFRCSPISLDTLNKKYVNITRFLPNKISLLNKYYKSQLTKEDLRIVKYFHRSTYNLLDKEYNKLKLSLNNKMSGVEVLYELFNLIK